MSPSGRAAPGEGRLGTPTLRNGGSSASARTIRIAVVVNRFPHWSQTFVLDQVEALIRAGCDVRVFAAWRARGGLRHAKGRALAKLGHYADRRPIARLLSLPGMPASALRRAQERARRRLQRRAAKRFDLVLCHFGEVGLQVVEAARGLSGSAPVWTIFHGYDLSRFILERGKDAYASLFRYGDRFLPISRLWEKRLRELGCPEDRIQILRMGVNCADIPFSRPRRLPGETVRILSVGRLVEKKGTRFSILALAQLHRAFPHLKWVFDIAGDGPLKHPLRALAEKAGIADRVNFLGALSTADVRKYLAEAHIFLLPSVVAADGDMEGIPVALMEAMAAGVPVVSTFHSGIPELVEHEVSGLLVAEGDTGALAEQLLTLVEDPPRCDALAEAAREKVAGEFDQERINRDLLASIVEAVSGRAG